MKIKGIIVSIVASGIIAAMALTGCSPTAKEADTQADMERIVIFGEITEKIGNMVSLNLMERPVFARMTDEEMADLRQRLADDFDGMDEFEVFGNFESFDRTNLPEGFVERFSEGMPGDWMERVTEGFSDGTLESFAGDIPDGMIERFAEGFPEGAVERFNEMMPGGVRGRGNIYTGETKEIIIPAGAPIRESSNVGGEQTESDITLDKLKVGDIVEITYASDGETVAKVVKQATTTGNRRTNSSGFGGDFFGMPGGRIDVQIMP